MADTASESALAAFSTRSYKNDYEEQMLYMLLMYLMRKNRVSKVGMKVGMLVTLKRSYMVAELCRNLMLSLLQRVCRTLHCPQNHLLKETAMRRLRCIQQQAQEHMFLQWCQGKSLETSHRLKVELPEGTKIEEWSNHDIECLPRGWLQTIFGFISFTDLSSCAAICHWLFYLPCQYYRPLASHLKTPPRAHLRCSRTEQRYYRGTRSWQQDCSEALKWLQSSQAPSS